MKLKLQLFLTLLLVSGCASISESYSPDGRKAYALNCSGTARGWDKCFTAAGKLCGEKGYDVLDKNTEEQVTAGHGAEANVNRYGGNASSQGFFGKTNERSMLIACKSKN